LNDSKSRWIFGEVQLDHILANIFWEDNDKFYEMQYNFPETKVIVDCVVKTHQGLIPIDSKFPLVNYQKMFEEWLSAEERTAAKKLFVSWVKKQIDDISSKYIIHEKTLDSALMFIPAESVFAELYTNFFEIIDYAHSKWVNIVSPTTLMAMLTIVLIAMKSLETQKQAIIIQRELGWLSIEFNRFVDRRWTFTKDFDKVHSDVTGIDITNKKIISKFASIEKLEFIEENDEDNPKAIL
jgi:DNA recombination protein RmuC